MAKHRPVIGITFGDPAGIGPEIIGASLACFPRQLPPVEFRLIGSVEGARPGRPTLRTALQAVAALEESVVLLRSGEIDAVVNGPVHKARLAAVGFDFPGQTEFYADHFGLKAGDVSMLMASPRLNVVLATCHLSLRAALRALDSEAVVEAGCRLAAHLRATGVKKPRLAVAGLNPHAGDNGLFGDEEARILVPAVRALRRVARCPVAGPVSPDAIFKQAYGGVFDGVVALYHDQGLIPFKMVAFDEGVNVTLGLPVVRCAPDHGTAFELAGTGTARLHSMAAALAVAVHLTRRGARP